MKLYIVTGFSLGPLSRAIAFTVSGRSYASKHRTLTSPFFLARLHPHYSIPTKKIRGHKKYQILTKTLPQQGQLVTIKCKKEVPKNRDSFLITTRLKITYN